MKKFDYHRPQSLPDMFAVMKEYGAGARYIAGGTDMIVRIKRRMLQPEALVSLTNIAELRGVQHNGGLKLGSMTPLREIERDPLIARHHSALSQAVSRLANPQIRNVATVGGNLCNAAPSADCAPPLLVMEAVLTLRGPEGSRELPLNDFFAGPRETCLNPMELMAQISVPPTDSRTRTAFLKMGRTAQDIAIANVAALLVMDGAICVKCRVAVGAVAPVPMRVSAVEDLMAGKKIDSNLLGQAEELTRKAVSPITDVRSTAEYRRYASGVLVKRALTQALKNGTGVKGK